MQTWQHTECSQEDERVHRQVQSHALLPDGLVPPRPGSIFILALIVLIFARIVVVALLLEVRSAQRRLVRQLVDEVALETTDDEDDAEHDDDDQRDEKRLVVETGLCDVAEVKCHIWEGQEAADDVEYSSDDGACLAEAATLLECGAFECFLSCRKMVVITANVLIFG